MISTEPLCCGSVCFSVVGLQRRHPIPPPGVCRNSSPTTAFPIRFSRRSRCRGGNFRGLIARVRRPNSLPPPPSPAHLHPMMLAAILRHVTINAGWKLRPGQPFSVRIHLMDCLLPAECSRICRRKHGNSKDGIESFPSSAAAACLVSGRPFAGDATSSGMVFPHSG